MKNKNSAARNREDLLKMISGMRSASDAFYCAAVAVGNHAFIEFTGLMNEYIKLCEEAMASGEDFTQANVHVGQPLSMRGYHARYLGEKFGCIFGTAFASDAELVEAFSEAAFSSPVRSPGKVQAEGAAASGE